MKIKVFYGPKPKLTARDKECFSTDKARCVGLFVDNKDKPVVILNEEGTPMPYRVQFGMSHVVFATLNEAIEFARKRFKEVK